MSQSAPQHIEGPSHRRMPSWTYARALGRRDGEAETLLGPDGPIARALPGYQPREPQLFMASQIELGLKLRKPVVAEGGCGVGKSLAYLVALILWCQANQKRAVVATATLGLMDQLERDLAFLRQHLGLEFRYKILKGLSNYLCEAQASRLSLDFDERVATVNEWARTTATGDLSELPFNIYAVPDLRAAFTVTADDCEGRGCDHAKAGACHYFKARDEAAEADIVVVSHALLMMDLILPAPILGEYGAVVVDEAHQLEEYARRALSRNVSAVEAGKLFKKLEKAGVSPGDSRDVGRAFFKVIHPYVRQACSASESGTARVSADHMPADLVEGANAFESALGRVRVAISEEAFALPEDSPRLNALQTLDRMLGDLQGDVRGCVKPEAGRVLWGEIGEDGWPVVHSTPVDVAGFLRSRLFKRERDPIPTVLTSATLSTGEGIGAFDYLSASLGVDRPLEVQVPSPFDFQRHLLYYVPAGIPEDVLERGTRESQAAYYQRYSRTLAPHVEEILAATRGRAFVLCTSRGSMEALRKRVKTQYDTCQQGDMGKQETIRWFKETPNAVLFATATFWEGVDIPGEALSAVIIDRLPFPVPTDPVEQEIARRLGRGIQAFFKRSLPLAIVKIKQGAGRVIRTETDKGLIAILDPRIRTKDYGPRILAALPGAPTLGRLLKPSSLQHVAAFLYGRAA